MASVLTFWQLPDEEAAFFRDLARGGVVAVRCQEAVPDPAALVPVPVAELAGRSDAGRLFLFPDAALADPLPLRRWEPEEPGGPARYAPAAGVPAVIYDAGTVRGGALSLSSATAAPAAAPAATAAWMRRVVARLRRAAPHWHEHERYRLTESAARAARGGLVLVPYHGWRGRSTGRSGVLPADRPMAEANAASDPAGG